MRSIISRYYINYSTHDYVVPSAEYDFADGCKNMNDILIMFAMRPICDQDPIFKMSSESPESLLELRQNINQMLAPHKTPHTSP